MEEIDLKELLKNYTKVEVVVLGCTHFPLAKKEIEKVEIYYNPYTTELEGDLAIADVKDLF